MNKINLISLSLLTTLLISGCAQKSTQVTMPRTLAQTTLNTAVPANVPVGEVTYGIASWYGEKYHGNPTAYGETYDMNGVTAAHKTLPYNTLVKVTDLATNQSTTVRINDKGPFVQGRIIDLSKGAAQRLGLIHRGTMNVRLEVVGYAGTGTQMTQNSSSEVPACAGPNCQAKITKATNDMYAGTYNSFRNVSSTSVTENIPQNKIVTEQEQYFVALKQGNTVPKNKITLDNISNPSVPSYVEPVAPVEVTLSSAYNQAYQEETLVQMTVPSTQIAIQVGAFRKLAGATEYSNRYSLLDINHPANIKNYTENAQSLYKVQIEGFSSETKAQQFMSLHNLQSQGAFLIRK